MQNPLPLLRSYTTDWLEERDFVSSAAEFLQNQPNFWQKSTLEGHLTGSAWMITPDAQWVLLLHHRKLNRWLQPGGHVDSTDASMAETAQREAREECGIPDLNWISEDIFDVDVHEIPAKGTEPAHFHFDLRFLFSIEKDTPILHNTLETKGFSWVLIADLCTPDTPTSLRRMAQKTQNLHTGANRF